MAAVIALEISMSDDLLWLIQSVLCQSLCPAGIFFPPWKHNKAVIAPETSAVCWQPLCCLNNTVQLWEVRQGAKVQFTYGTQQHKSLWFTEKGHELIITKLTLSFFFLLLPCLVLSNKSPPCVSVRRGLVWIGALCLMTRQKRSGQQTDFWIGHKL